MAVETSLLAASLSTLLWHAKYCCSSEDMRWLTCQGGKKLWTWMWRRVGEGFEEGRGMRITIFCQINLITSNLFTNVTVQMPLNLLNLNSILLIYLNFHVHHCNLEINYKNIVTCTEICPNTLREVFQSLESSLYPQLHLKHMYMYQLFALCLRLKTNFCLKQTWFLKSFLWHPQITAWRPQIHVDIMTTLTHTWC